MAQAFAAQVAIYFLFTHLRRCSMPVAARISWLLDQFDAGANMAIHQSFNSTTQTEKFSFKLFPGTPVVGARPCMRDTIQKLLAAEPVFIVSDHGHTHKGSGIKEVTIYLKTFP